MHETAWGEITAPHANGLALGATGLCAHLVDEGSEHGSESDGKELETSQSGYRNHGHYRMRILLCTEGIRPC